MDTRELTNTTVRFCYLCCRSTLRDTEGDCTECQDREQAAEAYNVTQEMRGAEGTPFFDGVCVGALLVTGLYFLIHLAAYVNA